jgi:hypothetical protein
LLLHERNTMLSWDDVRDEPRPLLKLGIDDFEDRAAMLQGVRALTSYLKRDLGALLASLPSINDEL